MAMVQTTCVRAQVVGFASTTTLHTNQVRLLARHTLGNRQYKRLCPSLPSPLSIKFFLGRHCERKEAPNKETSRRSAPGGQRRSQLYFVCFFVKTDATPNSPGITDSPKKEKEKNPATCSKRFNIQSIRDRFHISTAHDASLSGRQCSANFSAIARVVALNCSVRWHSRCCCHYESEWSRECC